MSRRNWSGDPLGDQKLQLERLIKKAGDALDGQRGGGIDAAESFNDAPQYGTGYDGTETVTTFVFGLSTFGGPDIFTA